MMVRVEHDQRVHICMLLLLRTAALSAYISWNASNSLGLMPPASLDPAYSSRQGAPTTPASQPASAHLANRLLGISLA